MAQKRKNTIVRGYFERVSWKVLDKHRLAVRDLIRGHAGIYALYKNDHLYYVGLAANLMSRVNHHLRDRHKGKWDRFSVYLTIVDEHIRPLEALMIRIARPAGNRVQGRLAGASDLARTLAREMSERAKDDVAALIGGSAARRRRRSKAKGIRGSLALANLLERPLRLRAIYKGKEYRASLRRNGQIQFAGKLFGSPNMAARQIVRRPVDGWHFWRYRRGPKEWVSLRQIKR